MGRIIPFPHSAGSRVCWETGKGRKQAGTGRTGGRGGASGMNTASPGVLGKTTARTAVFKLKWENQMAIRKSPSCPVQDGSDGLRTACRAGKVAAGSARSASLHGGPGGGRCRAEPDAVRMPCVRERHVLALRTCRRARRCARRIASSVPTAFGAPAGATSAPPVRSRPEACRRPAAAVTLPTARPRR